MFSIADRSPQRNCTGLSRREFLRVGGLALGGLTLADLLAVRQCAAKEGTSLENKSVILLFLQGGPPQHETFDPKMTAPVEIRSTTGEVQTTLPGITFGGTFPRMARYADRLSVVRSFASRNAGHTYDSVTTGGNGTKAAMGAVYSHLVGSTNPVNGFPSNILVLPEAVKEGLTFVSNFESSALPTLTQTGTLGPRTAAFNPVGGTELVKAMELRIAREKFENRRALLRGLDDLRRDLDVAGTLERADRTQQQAFDIILRGTAEAFDLSKEDPRVVERYDTSKLFDMDEYTKLVNMRRTSNLLGKQLLLARRLCEAGCGFVTVSDCGWDLHADRNSAEGLTAMKPLGGQVDHVVTTFLDDVRERGLEDRILLIVTGEMGRTPKINRRGGRDHWAELTPLVVAGGGLKMGQVIGQSDSQGGQPATQAYTPQNLFSTVLHWLFDLGKLRLRPGLGQELRTAIEGYPPIEELF